MKKLILSSLVTISLIAGDEVNIGNIVGNAVDDIVGGATDQIGKLFDNLNKDTFGMCYVPKKIVVSDNICGFLDGIDKNVNIDFCSALPDIPGFDKKSSKYSISTHLKDYCNRNIKNAINNTLDDFNNYGIENSNGTYAKGRSVNDFYNKVATVENIVDKKSLLSSSFLGGKNGVVNEILNVAKTKGITDLETITVDDLKAPKTYKAYLDERTALAELNNVDSISTSPTKLSSELEGASNISEQVSRAIDTIRSNTPKRVGYEIDLQRRDDDLAIPTQETLDVYVDALKPDMLVKMKRQIKREAKIKARVELEDNIKANIVQLIGRKAGILAMSFNRAEAQEQINKIIEDTKKKYKEENADKD